MSFWKKGRRKWIALTMALVMAFTAISWDMLKKESKAKEVKETGSEFSEEELYNYLELLEASNEVKELKNERTKDSTTYSYGNGLKKVVYYSDDVRYADSRHNSSLYQSLQAENQDHRGSVDSWCDLAVHVSYRTDGHVRRNVSVFAVVFSFG